MTLRKPNIIRGADSNFTIYVVDADGRPVDLTGYTLLKLRLPKGNSGSITVTSEETPAVAAYTTVTIGSEIVTITADTLGITGNSVSLVFDGVDDLDTVIDAWNTANPSNTVSHDATGDEVPSAQTLELDQGSAAYKKLNAPSPLELGVILVTLPDTDTEDLRIGKNLTAELTIDRGAASAGNRTMVLIKDAMSVEERFF
jgi:hypothetical protein